ncbi:uncharacterized protein EI97DRAFT_437912 [Westerdykella ornata]|uniref:DUF1275 domain protein n=1 Tax=Westerdykella ornata TaxID=318751 RepID=A0A6A6J603_WESOR|nr:uncharacterized protein EI97DRAFT_437912 [Westerdykella ornata]KAF2271398.1 hypothetical protein EI97DRAFT_437912 [Westerdykella ornata]
MSGLTLGQDGRADEETPPLSRRSGKRSDNTRIWSRVKKHHNRNISKSWGDLVLLFCYLITGLLDSAATQSWGCFVSMQTGNTVYFGLGLASPHSDTRWIKAGVSLACFCLGSFFFSRFHRLFSPRRRWVLVSSSLIQLLFVTLAALIVTLAKNATGPESTTELHWQVLVPLGAVAFQSSGQAVLSRVLQHNGLTSVVLTSNYCDLFSDPRLFSAVNVERNRRVAAPVMLALGALAGGFWARSKAGMMGSLWTAVVLKAGIVVAWEVWKAEEEVGED